MANYTWTDALGIIHYQTGGAAPINATVTSPPNSTNVSSIVSIEPANTTVMSLDELNAAISATRNLPPTTDELIAFANNILYGYWSGTLQVNIGTDAAPITALVDVSAKGQSDVLGLIQDLTNGSMVETWYQSSGAISINQTQISTIGTSLKVYVQAALAIWQQAVNSINASPQTITTYAQITELSWPARAET